MYNKVILVGNLSQEPKEYGQNEKRICVLNLAVNRVFKRPGTPEADFFKILTFGKTADSCMAYLEKGKRVLVEGRVERNPYKDKDGKDRESVEIVAEAVRFLSPAGERIKAEGDSSFPEIDNPFTDDDDLPF